MRSGQRRPALRTRSPGLCTVPAALKDPCVRACVRPSTPPQGAGGARGQRWRPAPVLPVRVLCFHSLVPLANGNSCQTNERLVAVVLRRMYSGMTITKGLDTNAGRTGTAATAQAPPPKLLVPPPPSANPLLRGASVYSEPNPTTCGSHVM